MAATVATWHSGFPPQHYYSIWFLVSAIISTAKEFSQSYISGQITFAWFYEKRIEPCQGSTWYSTFKMLHCTFTKDRNLSKMLTVRAKVSGRNSKSLFRSQSHLIVLSRTEGVISLPWYNINILWLVVDSQSSRAAAYMYVVHCKWFPKVESKSNPVRIRPVKGAFITLTISTPNIESMANPIKQCCCIFEPSCASLTNANIRATGRDTAKCVHYWWPLILLIYFLPYARCACKIKYGYLPL